MDKQAQAVIDYRATHNLSQKAFADIIGLSVITISNIEHGFSTSKTTTAKIRLFLEKQGDKNVQI